LSLVFCLAFALNSCKQNIEPTISETDEETVSESNFQPITAQDMETSIIYEANIRQYSPEGTFDAFTKDLPELKKLGVKIIWLMPIFPISEEKRKATGDLMVSDIEDEEERKKYLGSYYAVQDFKAVNPEFGTLEDFRKLLSEAHDLGMYVILDWVPNHTGWDHHWITEHPEYYTKNSDGEITDPLDDEGKPVGWADVADLNYDNPELRKAMIADMQYWIEKENIDGFRCDVAGSVPTDFWEEAIPRLREKKSIFMLAEAWEPELLKGELFDMCYGWDMHHVLNEIAQEKKGKDALIARLNENEAQYENDDIIMNFVTNHDENSWNGTIEERMGDAAALMTTLTYVMPGMPLIYSGQEYGMRHRLKFFEKDSIPKTKAAEWDLLVKLGKLKREHPALHGGKNAAGSTVIPNEEASIFVLQRTSGKAKALLVANLSAQSVTAKFELPFDAKEYFSREQQSAAIIEQEFPAWAYKLYITE
ncbi:MAG: alpha-amylase family glycosyl hydrolase, partial [Flavobacteriaceae bacterium]|nr:alpha-amylase family glycosyl hydrolase [Flavobacteriaceae bacterium]